ncbi:hypothetical protein SEA_GREKAYCON_62 [Arthrobacter phage Grekaycon]|uniref:Uncharacterized protein n=4 Tax=Marthavirus TaxID=1980936 RepID=A0A514A5M1_9CAUD|nr:hypothetical protein FDI42_gp61 [Arthrobacter phage Shade]YP_009884282.1 hypothetical protein HYP98_gp61 [Arthrobacter phage Zartrosa]QDH48552.1 hypothetical protein SEA_GREKAYCON_62 [Arthrobacter phage Grekaycon]QED11801.1 hypothetical protein SEA_BOSSLADY_63 [Arthrobacter phage BossLady]ASR80766.1 hypothetical protein SEA_SHADE_61 [Arthrobacter phage Shade]QED11173.1 hypothetical protein SEA_ZARTROSA_61 [Arthrobacter phage Zartrosa]
MAEFNHKTALRELVRLQTGEKCREIVNGIIDTLPDVLHTEDVRDVDIANVILQGLTTRSEGITE